jgi:tight adherence protein C
VALAAIALVVWPPAIVGVIVWRPVRSRVAQVRARQRHRAQVATALPDSLDVLVLAIGAGQTVALAVGTAARLAPPPVDAAFAQVDRRRSRGERLADALGSLTDRLGEPARAMQAALVSSERYGVPLGPTLDQLALDARRERRRQAEMAARKLPVRLSFPLVGCILPAFGLLTLAPLLAGAVSSLRL